METILTKTKHSLMTRDYCGGVNYSGGAMMGGGTVGNPGVQPYKYGAKELDRQNGLDWSQLGIPILCSVFLFSIKLVEKY